MEKKSLFKTILPFLPLLVVYIAVVLLFSYDDIVADEGRYMEYATNLTHGFYADANDPALRNGPGYPLILAPFVFFDIPHIVIKLVNPLFLLMAVVFFFKTVSFYIKPTQAIALSYLLGLYPAFLKWMTYMHSESFSLFLICGFLYYFIKLNKHNAKNYLNIGLSASFLGILALTKVIFVYVILAVFIFYLIAYFFKKSKKSKHGLIVLAVGFLFCIPYLGYTYAITGKTFYVGTQSGEILYWRSTPFANEHGDWISSDIVLKDYTDDYFDIESISKNHGDFIRSVAPYSHIERDNKFKEKAIENIKEHPIKYFQNTIYSALRLFFNYPYSYTPQKASTFFYIIPNVFLLTFLLLAVFFAFQKRAAIPLEIRYIGLISLIFMGGLVLSDGRVRHLLPIVPVLLFFIIFVFDRLLEFKINEKLDEKH